VGKLTFDGSVYQFVYTKGAQKSPRFIPFGRMTDLRVTYESDELFPLFANRLLSKSRPEYRELLRWLNLREHDDDPLALLARTGGLRETDSMEVFPCPERTSKNQYHVHFFVHGIRHLPERAIESIEKLKEGEPLFLMQDLQNPYDPLALALRTHDPATFVGYCPRYLSEDLLTILSERGADAVSVTVERVNREAPLQLRLLCNVTGCWPAGFSPCSGEMYEPLVADANFQIRDRTESINTPT
jgi:hypothetical protein